MDDTLVSQLAPYRDRPGIKAALLISHDGFLVAASCDDDINAEAVAAQVAGVLDIGARLADELKQDSAGYITIELTELNVVLAPFTDELLLGLIGTPAAIGLHYTLRSASS